jgi:nucleoside-diphosphate kinase
MGWVHLPGPFIVSVQFAGGLVERTLIIIKPDAMQRGLIGEIIRRFENRGLRIVGMKFIHMSRELAGRHYAVHQGKLFYEGLINYITASPVVVMVLEGTLAVTVARNTIGATKPAEAATGTIRGDFGLEVGRNLVHGSDSVENAEKEINLFFSPEELVDWTRDTDRWIFEG